EKLSDMIQAHVVSVTHNTAVSAAMVFEIRALMHIKPPAKNARKADREAYANLMQRRDDFFARRDDFEALYRRVIQNGIDTGAFRPVDVGIFTKTMLGAHNWVGVWYRDGGRLTGEAIAQQMAEIFLRALKP
ncbi:MAG: hypothetical protein D6737_17095, partial [Chloroflexi bacterium]